MILEREMNEKSEIPVDEYIGDVLVVALYLDKAPTSTEYEEHGRFSETSGRRKFGTWDNTLGMVCSEVFDMRPNLGYVSYLLDNMMEEKGRVVERKEFMQEQEDVNYQQNFEWEAAKYEAGCDVDAIEGIDKDTAIEHYRKYREEIGDNCTTRIEYILDGMHREFGFHPSDYVRHFSIVKEADALAGFLDEEGPYYLAEGRGTRFKLDNMVKVSNLVQSGTPLSKLPISGRRAFNNIHNSVRESLPESFFDSDLAE